MANRKQNCKQIWNLRRKLSFHLTNVFCHFLTFNSPDNNSLNPNKDKPSTKIFNIGFTLNCNVANTITGADSI